MEEIPALVARGALAPDAVPDPHWREDGCRACHTTAPRLRGATVEAVCARCHDARFDHSYIHPVGVRADDAMMARMPEDYRRTVAASGGRVSCTTCHDLPAQCLRERRREKALNPRFFRRGPFRARTEQCYFCHDRDRYQRLNPHRQRDGAGAIRAPACRICHQEPLERLRAATGVADLALARDPDPKQLCLRCHRRIRHPATALTFGTQRPEVDHFVVPPPEIAAQIRAQQASTGLILPLEPLTGRVYCATCHDPHQRGVVEIPGLTAEPGTRHRLRAHEICLRCHAK